MPEEQSREEKFAEMAKIWSTNSLIWASLAATNFVLVATIVTALSFRTNVFFEISASLFLLSGGLFGSSWGLFQAACGAWQVKVRDKRTKNYAVNPREIYVKHAENISLAGTLTYVAGICFLLIFIGMLATLIAFVIVAVFAFGYVVPKYFLRRE